jgi:protein TIF31
MESPDTCANSCFYLAFNGNRVNDYLELGEIEGITLESEFEFVEGIYKEVIEKHAPNFLILNCGCHCR